MKQLIHFFKKIPYRTNYLAKVLLLYKNPFQILSMALFSAPQKTTKLSLRNGLSFFVRKNLWDFFVLNEIMVKKEYSAIEKNLSTPAMIIDVGAHIGSFSVFYAKKFPLAKFFCFEPMPKNFELLKKNIKENNLSDQVFAFNFAVVGKKTSDKLPFYICEENPACNSLDKEYSANDSKKILVDTISFSQVFQSNKISECDLLKLDCENAEFDIIHASRKEFSKINSVVLEYHDPKKLGPITKLLESYGFKTRKVPETILLSAQRKN